MKVWSDAVGSGEILSRIGGKKSCTCNACCFQNDEKDNLKSVQISKESERASVPNSSLYLKNLLLLHLHRHVNTFKNAATQN